MCTFCNAYEKVWGVCLSESLVWVITKGVWITPPAIHVSTSHKDLKFKKLDFFYRNLDQKCSIYIKNLLYPQYYIYITICVTQWPEGPRNSSFFFTKHQNRSIYIENLISSKYGRHLRYIYIYTSQVAPMW